MKKALLLIFIVTFLTFSLFAGGQECQLYFSGGIDYLFNYGSEDDYAPGENDFPVTPAHTSPCFGLGFSYFFTDALGIEVDGRYYLSSKVTLTDPSDDDTIEYTTGKHLSMTLNLVYRFKKGNLMPYVVLGGGMDQLFAKDKTYTSAYDYEIEFTAPDKKLDPMCNIGGGIQFLFRPNAGARVDIRYMIIFAKPDRIIGLNLMAGVFIRF
jgi:outer membrane protein W